MPKGLRTEERLREIPVEESWVAASPNVLVVGKHEVVLRGEHNPDGVHPGRMAKSVVHDAGHGCCAMAARIEASNSWAASLEIHNGCEW